MSISRDQSACTVQYFGTYSKAKNVKDPKFFPSWCSPEGWHVYKTNKPSHLYSPEVKDIAVIDIVASDFELSPHHTLPLHIINKYGDNPNNEYSFYAFALPISVVDTGVDLDRLRQVSLVACHAFARAPTEGVVPIDSLSSSDTQYEIPCLGPACDKHHFAAHTHQSVDPKALGHSERPSFEAARQKELDAFTSNDVYVREPLSSVGNRVRPIPTRWVDKRKIKIHDDGSVVTFFKSRLVAVGFLDQRLKDPENIDVSTAMPPIDALRLFIFMCKAVKPDFSPDDLLQADVNTAFLTAAIRSDKPVYVSPPRDHHDYGKYIWRLFKAMYGLSDSPRNFEVHLLEILISLSWCKTIFDGVFIRYTADGKIDGILLV
jgi:hypothetical protein